MGATATPPAAGVCSAESASLAEDRTKVLDTGLLSLLIVARFHGLPPILIRCATSSEPPAGP